jgi:hypothetical protein
MKRKLHFEGDVTIDQLFNDYKTEIYDNVLASIKENYKKDEMDEINVVKISTQSKEYLINLTRDKFVAMLERCISYFEPLEEYEKCQDCIDIIDEIKNTQPIYGI